MEEKMTRKLEELFNLPESSEIIKEDTVDKTVSKTREKAQNKAFQQMAEIDKIAAALPAVEGLGTMADNELNDVADRAIKAYEDLMDLGMNVEPRYASRMFEVAGNMLKTGLDAKVAKMDKKLKMIELQLKKEKLDKEDNSNSKIINGEGYVVTDRNSLLQRLKDADKDK
jgi:hypothetical protein